MALAAAVHAATYQWIDSQGGLHFTDNLKKVPAKYLNKVRKVDVQPVIQKNEQPSQPVQTLTDTAAQNTFAGHDEMWWRSSFEALRDEMKNLQEKLPGKRDQLAELRRIRTIYQKPGERIAYYDMLKEIERDEARVTKLRKQQADLDDAAAKAGVPLEWRK
jgi:hypothetical protein